MCARAQGWWDGARCCCAVFVLLTCGTAAIASGACHDPEQPVPVLARSSGPAARVGDTAGPPYRLEHRFCGCTRVRPRRTRAAYARGLGGAFARVHGLHLCARRCGHRVEVSGRAAGRQSQAFERLRLTPRRRPHASTDGAWPPSAVTLLLAATETADSTASAKLLDLTDGPRAVRKLVVVVAYISTWLMLPACGKVWFFACAATMITHAPPAHRRGRVLCRSLVDRRRRRPCRSIRPPSLAASWGIWMRFRRRCLWCTSSRRW